MTSKIELDTRLDPRIKAYFAGIDLRAAKPNVSSREELLAQENTRNPLAWPGMAKPEDVQGLPPVVISVNECDPLRDEGIGFYRLLLRSGVSARCRQVMGTVHATSLTSRDLHHDGQLDRQPLRSMQPADLSPVLH